jgi:hypothetical protein
METDIQRIEIGNSKHTLISEKEITPPKIAFDFSSEEITFDSMESTFDEQ